MTDKQFQIDNLGDKPVCELCYQRAVVIHHFISKGASERLRFEPLNAIKLCYLCHRLIHEQVGYNDKIIKKRGKEWVDKLNKIQYESKYTDIRFR